MNVNIIKILLIFLIFQNYLPNEYNENVNNFLAKFKYPITEIRTTEVIGHLNVHCQKIIACTAQRSLEG
jgi:hypothetical protein